MSDHKVPGEFEYGGILLPGIIGRDVLDKLQGGFRFSDSDVVVAAYPKSGITWLIEMIYLVMNGGDTETARRVVQESRVPYLEATKRGVSGLDAAEKRKPPRLIKTHLPYKFIEKSVKDAKTRVIVVMRNPKDTLVSLFHFYRMNITLGKFKGSWDEFYGLFQENKLAYGNWFEYTEGYWKLRSRSNVLILKYEEMVEDLSGTVQKIARFLDKKLTGEVIQKVVDYGSFERMKDNKAVNKTNFSKLLDQDVSKFMRKGKVGDWRNYFSESQSKEVDELFDKKLSAQGLHFKYDSIDEKIVLNSKL